MKNIVYIFMLIGALLLGSCSDMLETYPTEMVSGEQILSNADGAQTVMNGIYRAMYTADWGSGWLDENSGIMAYTLVGSLMGEDHLMDASGNGWFFFDYIYGVSGDYQHQAGRPYQTWNFFYKIITNANVVIAKKDELEGSQEDVDAVVGQAYAMRAFAYFNLIQFYQQSVTVDENAPGVPLYTEPTTIETEGKPRGTVEQVYSQINTDINLAVTLLENAKDGNWVRAHESYIDYYVANGLKARINMAQGTAANYTIAAAAAKEALTKPGLKVASLAEFAGWNNKLSPNVLWALEVIPTQSENFRGFFSHMDADAPGMYARSARQCVSKWLYRSIPATDARKGWWRDSLATTEIVANTSFRSFCQLKFKFANPTTRTGDYLIMRAEEMVLIAAEAECHLENYSEARNQIRKLGEKRDSNYALRLLTFINAKTYNANTVDPLLTLMDEILFQRRVELWGEAPRIFDLQRLGLGVTRVYPSSNHHAWGRFDEGPASIYYILPLPQAEFDGNPNISLSEQNPM